MAKWFDKQFEENTMFVSEQKNTDAKNDHNNSYTKKAVNSQITKYINYSALLIATVIYIVMTTCFLFFIYAASLTHNLNTITPLFIITTIVITIISLAYCAVVYALLFSGIRHIESHKVSFHDDDEE
uniref:hypothetical protein n=1 Tax=Candidatus Cryptobacteroides bacterium TaxID=3085639 RepID=UPI004027E691